MITSCISGKLEIIKYLVEKGADIDVKCGKSERTPLVWASICHRFEVIKFLIKEGVNYEEREGDGGESIIYNFNNLYYI